MARPTGSLNKNKDFLLKKLQAMYGDDFDPIMKMAEIASNKSNDDVLKLSAWKEVAQYVYPKLKSVEITPGEDEEGKPLKWTIEVVKPNNT